MKSLSILLSMTVLTVAAAWSLAQATKPIGETNSEESEQVETKLKKDDAKEGLHDGTDKAYRFRTQATRGKPDRDETCECSHFIRNLNKEKQLPVSWKDASISFLRLQEGGYNLNQTVRWKPVPQGRDVAYGETEQNHADVPTYPTAKAAMGAEDDAYEKAVKERYAKLQKRLEEEKDGSPTPLTTKCDARLTNRTGKAKYKVSFKLESEVSPVAGDIVYNYTLETTPTLGRSYYASPALLMAMLRNVGTKGESINSDLAFAYDEHPLKFKVTVSREARNRYHLSERTIDISVLDAQTLEIIGTFTATVYFPEPSEKK